MAPHSMDTILQPPQWPAAFSTFVTWCLMWDPKSRPTSAQAMNHEYFADAVDPVRPKSSASRLLSRKHSDLSHKGLKELGDGSPVSSKPSWFRKSLITRDSAPAVPQHTHAKQITTPRPSPAHSTITVEVPVAAKARPLANKRATWTNGTTPSVGAPMPILPSIRPISPLSDAVTAQATSTLANENRIEGSNGTSVMDDKTAKKIGRQLSVASHGNHYTDIHRQEAERALNGNGGLVSPPNGQKESFFSHLRKRARRLSGRHATPLSPSSDDIEANAGCGPWSSNRSSMALDAPPVVAPTSNTDFTELDKVLQNVRYSIETSSQPGMAQPSNITKRAPSILPSNPTLKRHHSLPQGQQTASFENLSAAAASNFGPISSRTRRALQMSDHPVHRYETPDEEDELLDEVLNSAHKAAKRLDRNVKGENDSYRNALAHKDSNRQPLRQTASNVALNSNPYPTPSPSAKRNGVLFGQDFSDEPTKPLNIAKTRSADEDAPKWPTPPYAENEWGSSAAASIYAAGSSYR